MGEAYLAQVTRLDRKVALKILPADFAANEDRMYRFVLEAKAAADPDESMQPLSRFKHILLENVKRPIDRDVDALIGETASSDAWRKDGAVVLTGRAEAVYNGEWCD